MGFSGRKRLAVLVILSLLMAAGAGMLLAGHLRASAERGRADRLLAEFRANPCQQTADPLIRMLNECQLAGEQASRVLWALLEPEVVVREPVLPGSRLAVSIRGKHDVTMTGGTAGFSWRLQIDRVTRIGPEERSVSVDLQPYFSRGFGHVMGVFPDGPALRAKSPGTYPGVLHMECFLYTGYFPQSSKARKVLEKLRVLRPQFEVREYHCAYQIPFEIRVLPAPRSTDPGSPCTSPADSPGHSVRLDW